MDQRTAPSNDTSGRTSAHDTWARHRPALSWCHVATVDDSSYRTSCKGAWNASDLVEIHDNPAVAERCVACVRQLEAERVAAGLAEIVSNANAPRPLFDVEMVDAAFDDGGEG